MSPRITTGKGGWKQTQEWSRPHNNPNSAGPEGLIGTSRAQNIVLTRSAGTTNGKGWMAVVTLGKLDKKEPCGRTTGGNTGREDP